MNYAIPAVSQQPRSEARTRPLMVPCTRPVTAQPAANEDAPVHAAALRPVDPMLLIYQERIETFRRIAAALRRGYRMLTRSFAS